VIVLPIFGEIGCPLGVSGFKSHTIAYAQLHLVPRAEHPEGVEQIVKGFMFEYKEFECVDFDNPDHQMAIRILSRVGCDTKKMSWLPEFKLDSRGRIDIPGFINGCNPKSFRIIRGVVVHPKYDMTGVRLCDMRKVNRTDIEVANWQ